MDRINHPTAVDRRFADADPVSGREATVIPPEHMNAVQEELVRTIEGAGLAPDAANEGQLLEAIQSLATTTSSSNLAINGGLRVWQRGTSFALAAAPLYTADRFEAAADSAGGAGTANVTRQLFASGQTDVPGAVQFLRYEQLVAPNGGGGFIRTKLEELARTAGRSVTVSFWARASASSTVAVGFAQVDSNDDVGLDPQDVAVGTDWARFSVTFDVPSLADSPGLSATDENGHVRVSLAMPTDSGVIFELAQLQVEVAAEASGFQLRPLALEELLCQRYYEKSYRMSFAPGSPTRGGIASAFVNGDELTTLDRRFRVPKRAIPTITYRTPDGTGGRVLFDSGGAGSSLVIAQVVQTSPASTGYPRLTAPADSSAPVIAHWTADAEL